MLTDLEQGDVAQTNKLYAKSRLVTPVEKGGLQLDEVDYCSSRVVPALARRSNSGVLYKSSSEPLSMTSGCLSAC